jgi:diaminopimelate epimerase
MKFTKMEGLGNDYVYVDGWREKVRNPSALAVRISDRHFGVGADGLILILPSAKADARMEMYNADGSRAEMCGNGIRCVAKYLYDRSIARKQDLRIETDAGVKELRVFASSGVVGRVRVNMGRPELERQKIPMKGPKGRVVGEPLAVLDRVFRITAVNMGNPHCVSFIKDVDAFEIAKYGPAVEHHASFPARVNAEFAEVIDRTHVKVRVWERGSGETLACGTGACATCVAAVLSDLTARSVTVHLPGGDLEVEWSENHDTVAMTGPVREVFTGDWPAGE